MKKGSIWSVNLDPTIGAEIKKTRPCIILNSDKVGKLPLKVIAPLTDFKEHYSLVPWMIILEPTVKNGLKKTSTIDIFQIRSVSQKRLIKKIGEVDNSILQRCRKAIDTVFE